MLVFDSSRTPSFSLECGIKRFVYQIRTGCGRSDWRFITTYCLTLVVKNLPQTLWLTFLSSSRILLMFQRSVAKYIRLVDSLESSEIISSQDIIECLLKSEKTDATDCKGGTTCFSMARIRLSDWFSIENPCSRLGII